MWRSRDVYALGQDVGLDNETIRPYQQDLDCRETRQSGSTKLVLQPTDAPGYGGRFEQAEHMMLAQKMRIDDRQTQTDKTRHALQRYEAAYDDLTKRMEALSVECGELEHSLDNVVSRRAAQPALLDLCSSQVAQQREALTQRRARLRILIRVIEEESRTMTAWRDTLRAHNADVAWMQNALKEVDESRASNSKRRAALLERRSELELQREPLRAAAEDAQERAAQAAKNARARERNQSDGTSAQDLRDRLAEVRNRGQTLQTELTARKVRWQEVLRTQALCKRRARLETALEVIARHRRHLDALEAQQRTLSAAKKAERVRLAREKQHERDQESQQQQQLLLQQQQQEELQQQRIPEHNQDDHQVLQQQEPQNRIQQQQQQQHKQQQQRARSNKDEWHTLSAGEKDADAPPSGQAHDTSSPREPPRRRRASMWSESGADCRAAPRPAATGFRRRGERKPIFRKRPARAAREAFVRRPPRQRHETVSETGSLAEAQARPFCEVPKQQAFAPQRPQTPTSKPTPSFDLFADDDDEVDEADDEVDEADDQEGN